MHDTDIPLKTTALTSRHIALGARMTPYAGYSMPVVYSTITEEHLAVRNSVGVFDVSHMGEFIVRGREALDLLQKVTSNDAAKLEIGEAQYSCLPNHQGGIVDDLIVYRLPEDMCAEGEMAFMLVVNAANITKDWDWISAQNDFDARLINISDDTALLAVQGPKAIEVLQPLTDIDLEEIAFYTFRKGTLGGVSNVLVSATGYTGSGGFELYGRAGEMATIWDALLNRDSPHKVHPAGLGARDTLRLEMGYCLYGNDIDDATSPLEAGLGWITKFSKGDFNGADLLKQQKESGIRRKLVGISVDDRRVPRQGYPITDRDGKEIGVVTSGTLSPCLQHPIGMGYVLTEHAQPGTPVAVQANRKSLTAQVVRPPFYKKEDGCG